MSERVLRVLVIPAALLTAALVAGAGLLAWRHRHPAWPLGGELIGARAPDFRLPRRDGQPGELGLADFAGHPLLIEFFATWCPPCARIGSAVGGFANAYAPRGLATIGVSCDDAESLARLPDFLAQHGIAYPVVGAGTGHAGAVVDAYHAGSIPHLVLIGADGRVASANLAGATAEETVRNLQLAVRPLLGGD